MTKQQMITVFDKYSIKGNEWIEIGDDIVVMPLKTKGYIQFDDRYMRCKFNHDMELVEIVNGRTINGVFTTDDGETSNYKATTYIPYSVIISVGCTVDKFENARLGQKSFPIIKEYI